MRNEKEKILEYLGRFLGWVGVHWRFSVALVLRHKRNNTRTVYSRPRRSVSGAVRRNRREGRQAQHRDSRPLQLTPGHDRLHFRVSRRYCIGIIDGMVSGY